MKIELNGIVTRDEHDWMFIADNKIYSDSVLNAIDEILNKNEYEDVDENQKIKITIEME
jgi:hypothetical protein